LRILYLEDDVTDAELVQERLNSDGIVCQITRVETRAAFAASLREGGIDLILADYSLPSFDGLSALKVAQKEWAHVPFIFLSGTLGEELAVEALKSGATDYVSKTLLSRLAPSVRRALREARERAELSRAEQALRRSESYLAEGQRLSHTGSFGWNVLSGEIYWSRETFRIFEYEPSSRITIERILERTHPEDRLALQRLIERVARERKAFDLEHRLLMPDDSIKYLRVVAHPSTDEFGTLEFVGVVTDVTERKRAEEIRVAERTRIARELHDTLLQSFHGLMLLFRVAYEHLPSRPLEAKQALDRALECAEGALVEGRDAVHDLRLSTAVGLAQALTTFGEELAALDTDAGMPRAPTFRVLTEGTPQQLHPMVREEICRIALEALRNAFRHAQARQIEVEIIYSDLLLQVRIRDDGKGIDPAILSRSGSAGHWGLVGMRERAIKIDAKLDIRSQRGAGTEVELSLPSSVSEPP